PAIEQAAAGRGLFSIKPERDGIIRRVPVVMLAQDTLVPALTLEMLRVVTRAGAILVRTDDAGVRAVAVPGLEVPTDGNCQFWVHFNKHDPARYVSAADVLHGRSPADRFNGRLVLIGTSATGLLDIKTTPVEPAMPGVEVHAQILESVLTQALLARPNYAIAVELVAAVVFGIAIIIAAPMLPASIVIAIGALLIAGLIGVSLYFFVAHNLFIDVRGFTTISEHYKDDPQGLTRLMNRFLTPLTNAIIERKGTIDKYIGDAIMAFWNAPVDDEEHEANACDAALEMLARAEALNVELKREAEANGSVYM